MKIVIPLLADSTEFLATLSESCPDRLIKDSGKWYFHTREGNMGPYVLKLQAKYQLDSYKKVMASGLTPQDRELTQHPLDVPYLSREGH